MIVRNDLYDYDNRYIYQDTELFKFSLDSVLLAEYVQKDKPKGAILDLCAGNAAIELILSKYLDNKLYGFEVQNKIYDLAIKSVNENKLSDQISIINDNANNIEKYFKKGTVPIIICNPPYFPVNKNIVNSNEEKAIARHEILINLEQIFDISKKFLENNGILYIINRSERLDEIINMGFKYNINVKEIQLIKTKVKKSPSIVIVKCKKNSGLNVKIKDVLNVENLSSYQNIFKE